MTKQPSSRSVAAVHLGCDPDALERLAAEHRRVGRRLQAITVEISRKRPEIERGSWSGADARAWWRVTDRTVIARAGVAASVHVDLARRLADQANQQRSASLAEPHRSVLSVDRAGDGRIVQRVGFADATTVVVLVPGVGTDLGDSSRLRDDAERVWSAVALGTPGQGGDLAVVSWLGYDPPDTVVEGIRRGPSAEGARHLAAYLDTLRAAGASRLVLVGHSYGAVTAARATAVRDRNSAGPDELVLLGAPGLGVAVGDLRLEGGSGLWSAMAQRDPIALVARAGVTHGPDPSSVALALPTSMPGHGSYLSDPVFLAALASVVGG